MIAEPNASANLLFILLFSVAAFALMGWGIARLPGEQWQILASVPRRRRGDGSWHGVNLTYYGLFVATANLLATLLFLVLAGAMGVTARQTMVLAVGTFAVSLPAASLVARLVEKRANTFTVSGASFAGFLAFPLIVSALSALQPSSWGPKLPLLPTFAALAIAYALGEGIGRLACISFGCCYGKPLSQCHPALRRLFARAALVFHGETKKIAYESGLEGEPVVPVQALTAAIGIATAVAGSALFLRGAYGWAFVVSVTTTQGWRLLSELLRADHRGFSRISAYQVFSVFSVLYAIALSLWSPATTAPADPSVLTGLTALWNPALILFLEGLWIGIFVYMGRSKVTASRLWVHVVADQA